MCMYNDMSMSTHIVCSSHRSSAVDPSCICICVACLCSPHVHYWSWSMLSARNSDVTRLYRNHIVHVRMVVMGEWMWTTYAGTGQGGVTHAHQSIRCSETRHITQQAHVMYSISVQTDHHASERPWLLQPVASHAPQHGTSAHAIVVYCFTHVRFSQAVHILT